MLVPILIAIPVILVANMPLDRIPNDILCLLPLYIDNIETFTNAAASCRRLRDALYTALPGTILRLAAASAPTFFSPHPHFLVAATARKAGEWALGNKARTEELRRALQEGICGLYDFCLQHSGLTLDDIRRMHLARFSIINPLWDKIDKMAGKQWYATPDFWDGGVSEPITLYTDADRPTFQILIYGELFAQSMDAFLQPERDLPSFDLPTRLDFFTYCVPDWLCKSYAGFEVLPTGPYAPDTERVQEDNQTTMHHILTCGRWRRMWAAVIRGLLLSDGEEFTDEHPEHEHWRKRLLRDALQCQGLEGMQLVTLPLEEIDQKYLERARRMKRQIDQLKEPPAAELLGRGPWIRRVSHAPDPSQETFIPGQGGMWMRGDHSPRISNSSNSSNSSDSSSDD